jgi:hypothetical protein
LTKTGTGLKTGGAGTGLGDAERPNPTSRRPIPGQERYGLLWMENEQLRLPSLGAPTRNRLMLGPDLLGVHQTDPDLLGESVEASSNHPTSPQETMSGVTRLDGCCDGYADRDRGIPCNWRIMQAPELVDVLQMDTDQLREQSVELNSGSYRIAKNPYQYTCGRLI